MSADQTNLSNWREPGHNTWGFQNVDKIINTESIKRPAKASPLPAKPHQFDYFKLDVPDKPPLDLPGFHQETATDGIVVLHGGNIVYEHYDRTNTEKSVHIMMSMTKSVTGLVCGILVDQGKLDVNALVSKYVPEIEGTPYESLRLRQLLDMRAGIKHDDGSPVYRRAAGWNPPEADDKADDLHSFTSSFKAPASAPVDGLDGPPFEYVSVNTDLMGWVVERASGHKFADLVSELIWQPMGAESDAYITVDKGGNPRTAGGMCATVRDIARLGQVVLQNDSSIVPATWIDDVLQNGSQGAFAAGSWYSRFSTVFDSSAYRSYWITDRDSQTLMGLGIHGQHLFVDRKNGIVMAKTSSQPDRADMSKFVLSMRAFKEFTRILTSKEGLNGA